MIQRTLKIVFLPLIEAKKEIKYLAATSRPRKILFDHLPKCGGTSLSAFLEAHYPRRKTFSINGVNPTASVKKFKAFRKSKRYEYDLIKGHLANQLINYAHPECLKVTVLREPVDRIVSHYYYAKRRPEHYLYRKIHKLNMTLEDYVTSGLSEELRNWYTTHFSGLTVKEAEKNPNVAVNKAFEILLNQYDIVGFLDNYLFFIERLRDQAGLVREYKNKKLNATSNRPHIEKIAKTTISVIEQMNHLDILLYKKIREAIG